MRQNTIPPAGPVGYPTPWTRPTLLGLVLFLLLIGFAPQAGLAADSSPSKWVTLDGGLLLDSRTGLEWTRRDNGEDVTWLQAEKVCADRPGHWRLPSIEELAALYTESDAVGTPCGNARCKLSGPFELTTEWFWSGNPVGSDDSDGNELAWGVLFVNGTRTKAVQYAGDRSRALCVRKPDRPVSVAPTPAQPEEVALPIDQSHTAVIFSWTHREFSHPSARLEQVQGTVSWNRDNLSRSHVEVTLPLAGLRTGDDSLDKRLRGHDFFDATDNPTITFKSTQIVPTEGTEQFTLVGMLTVRGMTKPVTLQAKINAIRDEPGQEIQVGFDAEGSFRRSDFDMGRYVPLVSDEISLRITLEAHSG